MARRPDPGCLERPDGTTCSLHQSYGVCADDRCRLLACAHGAGDCDGIEANGCEEGLSTASNCGACGRSCPVPSRCQEGPQGFACAVSVICPQGAWDLDGEGGCEWNAGWGEAQRDVPREIEIVRALRHTGFARVMLGLTDAPDRAPEALLLPGPDAEVVPLGVLLEPNARPGLDLVELDRAWIFASWGPQLWPALSGGDLEPTPAPLEPGCEARQHWRGVAALRSVAVAATDRDLVTLAQGDGCPGSEGWCVEPASRFGRVDYLRAFFPYADDAMLADPQAIAMPGWRLGSQELSACQACYLDKRTGAFAAQSGCAGADVCRPLNFDAPGCGACLNPIETCPGFELVDVFASDLKPGLVVVVTRRGLVTLSRSEEGWAPRLRVEAPFDPGQVGGPGVVAAALAPAQGNTQRVALIHSGGFVRSYELFLDEERNLSVRPAAPDLDLPLKVGRRQSLQIVAPSPELVAVTDGELLVLARLAAPAGRLEVVTLPGGLLGPQATPRALFEGRAEPESPLVEALFEAFGLYQVLTIAR